ncbi:uncharacterized protein F5891DRAFT_1195650 [Suillus fuscotomentosus]|uniref:Uncharacterized protein n=1 Tax=Suillus fuscotomentosus TaxID=1912939 RepID=A0AAD4HFY7_9AGAM|nr:uncharacterized protein F5891DRAFT_1195650 [Suillus fuscotomentosus]KAG1894089.1 hypothetical protein F5891DRAFT_1195650 [Suillus fuscotomentosus]
MSFQTFPYNPNDPTSCTRRQSAARPPVPGLSHRIFPYNRGATSAHGASSSRNSDSASTSIISTDAGAHSGGTDSAKKLYSPTEQVALTWVKRRIILNSVMTTGWLRNITSTEKKAMKIYILEIINQANIKFGCELEMSDSVADSVNKALLLNRRRLSKTSENLIDSYNIQPPTDTNLSDQDRQVFKNHHQTELFDSASPFTYYLHGHELTDVSVFVVLFANPVVESSHITHWYADKDTPLRDEDMRLKINTTPTQMFSESAASVRLAIRRAVSGKTTASGKPLPFSTDPYANEQDAVNEAMLLALGSPTHGPAMEAHMLGVHQRGMGVLRGAMGLEAPMKAISDPPTEEYLQIVSEVLQHALATGLLFPQISEELAMATHRDPSMPDYSISVYVPFSLEELTFP